MLRSGFTCSYNVYGPENNVDRALLRKVRDADEISIVLKKIRSFHGVM